MKLSAHLFILSLVLTGLNADKGVDISNYNGVIPQSTYQNFVNNGYNYAVVEAWQENHPNTDFNSNYNNAMAAGMNQVDAYAFVCNTCQGGTTPSQVVSSLQSTLGSNYKGTVWLDVESCTSCWSSNGQENYQFVQSVANQLQSNGYNVGVYSNANEWNQVMGSAASNTGLSNLPLWYAHYDGSADFNDPSAYQFGGWTTPTMKQYAGSQNLDGQSVDFDYGTPPSVSSKSTDESKSKSAQPSSKQSEKSSESDQSDSKSSEKSSKSSNSASQSSGKSFLSSSSKSSQSSVQSSSQSSAQSSSQSSAQSSSQSTGASSSNESSTSSQNSSTQSSESSDSDSETSNSSTGASSLSSGSSVSDDSSTASSGDSSESSNPSLSSSVESGSSDDESSSVNSSVPSESSNGVSSNSGLSNSNSYNSQGGNTYSQSFYSTQGSYNSFSSNFDFFIEFVERV